MTNEIPYDEKLKNLAEALTEERRRVVDRWINDQLDAEGAGQKIAELNKLIEEVEKAAKQEYEPVGLVGFIG